MRFDSLCLILDWSKTAKRITLKIEFGKGELFGCQISSFPADSNGFTDLDLVKIPSYVNFVTPVGRLTFTFGSDIADTVPK